MSEIGVAGQREVERKYAAPSDSPVPPTTALGTWTPARRLELVAEYYDTPGLDLTGAGVSLRRRTGGDDPGWHLKTPDADGFRIEAWLPAEASRYAVPTEFRARLGDLAEGRAVVMQATVRTLRDQAELVDAAGRRLASWCADEVTATAHRRQTCWRQVEIELAPGEPLATLDALDATLRAAGFRDADHRSKAARVLDWTPPSPPGPDSPAGDVVLAYAAAQVGAFQKHEAGVLEDRPDAVHKSRVAARRLRSLLGRFAPVLEPSTVAHLSNELRWYGEVAGAARDAEVLEERFEADLALLSPELREGPAAAELIGELRRRRASAHAALVAALATSRYLDLQRALGELVSGPSLSAAAERPARTVVAEILASAVTRVRRRLARAEARPAQEWRWHEVRKAAKAARYTCDALVAPFGPEARASSARWEAVTEALGEAQDASVAEETLVGLAPFVRAAGDDPRRAEELYQALAEAQRSSRADALGPGRAALAEALADDVGWASPAGPRPAAEGD